MTARDDGPGATLLTVGHGRLGEADLAALLVGAGVESLVDVRRFPGSRAHPHVAREALAGWLPGVGVAYRWEPRLGGRRRLPTGGDAPDAWWQVPAFRAYAAHTRGVEFTAALSEVLAEAARRRVAVLCSETPWWRCHRRLVADVAVLAHGVEVLHLMPGGRLSPHLPAAGARLLPGGQVLWDGEATPATPGNDDTSGGPHPGPVTTPDGGHPDRGPAAPHGSGEWDALYGESDRIWSGRPNGALVAAVAGLPPGRALDVGCGEGADAVWLAQRGWEVTGLDVSAVALARAAAAARSAGVDVRWLHSALVGAPLPSGRFDLVSAQYPALLRTPDDDAEHLLLAAVAPGGTLLVVHHADLDAEPAREHGFDPADYVSPGDVAALLDDGWQVQVDERRPRADPPEVSAHFTHDLVLQARRR